MYGVERYNGLCAEIDYLNAQLEELNHLMFSMDDEDEAEDMYGEERDEIEYRIETLYGEISEIDRHYDERDYYAGLL